MHRFASVSTSLLFAAHILLGCCAHHVHGHDSAAWHEQAAIGGGCGGHSCRSDHHDADQALSHDAGDCAGGPCSHGSCTYVKTDDTRIDRDGRQASWFAFSPPVGLLAAGCPSAERVLIATADACPAQLYLLHCALVI